MNNWKLMSLFLSTVCLLALTVVWVSCGASMESLIVFYFSNFKNLMYIVFNTYKQLRQLQSPSSTFSILFCHFSDICRHKFLAYVDRNWKIPSRWSMKGPNKVFFYWYYDILLWKSWLRHWLYYYKFNILI